MRHVRVDGTRGSAVGELRAVDGMLRVHDHKSGRARRISLPHTYDGHGGGERPLFSDFLGPRSGPGTSRRHLGGGLDSHRIAFAAMQSAAEGVVVHLDETRRDDVGRVQPS